MEIKINEVMEGERNRRESFLERDPPSYSLFMVQECYKDVAFKELGMEQVRKADNCVEKKYETLNIEDLKDEEEEEEEEEDDDEKGRGSGGEAESTKMDELFQKWRQFSSQTTLHGLKYVFDSRPMGVRG